MICSELIWNLPGVPWDQVPQGDQNLHWGLGLQQGQLNHDYQEDPNTKKGMDEEDTNAYDPTSTRSVKLLPRKWMMDSLPWHQLYHQLQEDHENQDYPTRKHMKQKGIRKKTWIW
jgi:hypothetical protein